MANSFNIRRYLTKSIVDVSQSVGGIHYPGVVNGTTVGSAVEVGASNIVRITVTTAGRITFGASTVAVAASTIDSVGIYLPIGVHYVYATDDYIRGDGTIVSTLVEVLSV